MEKFDKVTAHFEPKRLDTLRGEARSFVGKLMTFEALWIIDEEDGGPYVGQWAMRAYSQNKLGLLPFDWVPEEDIRIVAPPAPIPEGWQPIETAPKDGTAILFFVPEDEPQQVVGYFEAGNEEHQFWAYSEQLVQDVLGQANPTHWMPLPPAPIPEGWISVKDRLPELNMQVLVFTGGLMMQDELIEYTEQDTGYKEIEFGYPDCTHWMPLPAAPKGE